MGKTSFKNRATAPQLDQKKLEIEFKVAVLLSKKSKTLSG